ncbi:MAG: hypothetical protein AVDCRST_MAG55-604, partial [uncultured Rubrobacteraceae bacterium]
APPGAGHIIPAPEGDSPLGRPDPPRPLRAGGPRRPQSHRPARPRPGSPSRRVRPGLCLQGPHPSRKTCPTVQPVGPRVRPRRSAGL